MSQITRLMMCVSSLPAKDQNFANSLIEQAQRKQLSEKQLYWVDALILKTETKPETMPTAISVPGIIELIRRHNNAKRPKIRFLIGQDEFVISVASSQSSVPGSLNIVCNKIWYGRIHTDGRYEPSRRIAEDKNTEVVAALNAIAQDPVKAAMEYGKNTGHCCFCALKLDDPRSLVVGYGPICAKHYRLPWNASALEVELLVKKLTDQEAFG